MGIATVVSRSIGFVRVLVVAAVLGTTYLGNAFGSSNAVSNVIFELVAAGALSAVLVPTLVEQLDRNNFDEAERLAGRILGVALVVLGAVALVGIVLAPQIARLLTAGVTPEVIAERQIELSTFLLRFMIPQIIFYAVAAVAIAVLYAKRRLTATALAPIGLTIGIVAAMVVFRITAGPDPGLVLSTEERLVLALGATFGVILFMAIPLVALRRIGFRLVPQWGRHDPAVRKVLGLSGWAILQHSMIGLLLVGAIIVGNSVEGGTIAYQTAWVFFLAPYAILGAPVQAAILPDLARQSAQPKRFSASLKWALNANAVVLVPAGAFLVAAAIPIMEVAAFGQATQANGVNLLATALASLALGIYTYGAFLLMARAYYSLGDSRTPALVSLASALVGLAIMILGGVLYSGTTTVAFLGFGFSGAYLFGSLILWVKLRRRTGDDLFPSSLFPSLVVAVPLALAVWGTFELLGPQPRAVTAVVLVISGLVAAGIYVLGLRVFRIAPSLNPEYPQVDSGGD